MARGRFRAPMVVRRAPSAASGGIHHPDAAARYVVLRSDAPPAARSTLGALRHAPCAVGTLARRPPVFRVVLRNVAPFGVEPARAQEPLAVDARGRSAPCAVPHPRPATDAAHDAAGALPR